MLEEIYEQPQAIAATLEQEHAAVAALVSALREREIRHVIIAARGTSDHAATYAKYLFEIVMGIPVALAAPSVFTLYDAQMHLTGCLMLGISQSGQATDVVQTLSSARAAGALTACITNVPSSPLTSVSDFTLLCHAGEERAVAATKTYTASLALVALLAGQWSNHAGILQGLRALPDLIRSVLSLDEPIAQWVERYRYITECAVLARGLNQATALEAALKMTETSYLVAKAYSMADFLHGPVAIVRDGFPCFLYAPDGRAYPSMVELALKLRERNAEMVVFARSPEILDLARRPIAIPVEVDELLSPLLYIVPGQLWACHLAQARGLNPDRPRGLTKVTLTR
ncbi:MAG: SIS domain-containing protein [Chloroherpetonaceae bacterium]|nr:SIS domain-containing protein [Chthonomonadaceae bacterium]MDW8208158.1 SIS domain-containing protein [Chloroherpetonaceae bacterium]